MEDIQLKEEIASWASTKIESTVFVPEDNYYHFDIIADAYIKGGEQEKKRIHAKMTESLKRLVEEKTEILKSSLAGSISKLMEQEYRPTKIFIYMSIDESKVIYAIEESVYLTDEFLDYAYTMSADIKSESYNKGLPMSMGFIADNDKINLGALKSDGFDMAMDLKTGKHIY